MAKRGIYKGGVGSASRSRMIAENLIIIATVIVGAYALWSGPGFLGIPILGTLYLIFVVGMLAFVLRRNVCTHCWYYGRRCHCGWGLLAARLAKRKSGNYERGNRMAMATWMILMFAPLAWLVKMVIYHGLTYDRLWTMLAMVLLVIVNLAMHTRGCRSCRMRFICPGSAAKQG